MPAGDPRRIALGTVLRGTAAGMGQTSLMVAPEVWEALAQIFFNKYLYILMKVV